MGDYCFKIINNIFKRGVIMKKKLLATTMVLFIAVLLPVYGLAQPLDFGDAPEGALAYPSLGTGGSFPTCMNVGPANWIQHTNFGAWFGPVVDFEPEGNGGLCPSFAPYDNDECFMDGDAGLLIPPAYTIVQGVVTLCPNSSAGSLGLTCQTAVWGGNVDIDVHNTMPNHEPYLPAYVNVLMDWDQNGMWGGSSPCPPAGTPAPEQVLVDFVVPPLFIGPLSALMQAGTGFLIGPNSGYVWTRFTISEYPVGFGWTGEGYFEDGESEDYLLRVDPDDEPTVFPVIQTECPVIETECPTGETYCPAVFTRCPEIETECPAIETHCPIDLTLCPEIDTLCPADPILTICPEIATECPEILTECPIMPTYCPDLGYTYCPEDPTWCPIFFTECPLEPTFCPQGPTICVFTMCDIIPTWCPDIPTECPADFTLCPTIPTVCPDVITACPEVPTVCPTDQTNCPVVATSCPADPTYCSLVDSDGDGVDDCNDNCPNHPNGPIQGTCTEDTGVNWIVSTGQFCTVDGDCDPGEFCEKVQADNYPPGGNGIGDACDCESDFICDGDVDADDVTEFLNHFGRGQYNNPCSNSIPCSGDFICDVDVDADDVTKFLEDFGRGQYNLPCPSCTSGAWCTYP